MEESQIAKPGIVERAFTRLFTRAGKLVRNELVSSHFNMLEFEGEELRNVDWAPGDKVQIKLDGGMVTRTYTPMEWDREKGTTRFLAFCHGSGPGSEWARRAPVDDVRPFFGPRASISIDGLTSSARLFGDETSFALALAINHVAGTSNSGPTFVFEVNDKNESGHVLDQLGLANFTLFQRRADEAHLADVAHAILAGRDSRSLFFLTGKASSIQSVSRAVKAAGIGTRSLRTKAYWSPGKTGLD